MNTIISALATLAALGGCCLFLALYGTWKRRLAQLRDQDSQAVVATRSAVAGGATSNAGTHEPLPRALRYVESRMRAAGVDWPTSRVLTLIAGGGAAAGAAAYISTGIPWLAVAAMAVGYFVPLWRLNALAQVRAARVAAQLDGVCGQFVQALSGGMPLPDVIRQQSERAPDPTGTELRRIVQRQTHGENLTMLIGEFGQRIDLDEARLFSAGLRLTQEQGAVPRVVLESVQRTLRDRRDWQGLITELSAQSRSHATILTVVPLVLFPIMRFVAPGFTAPLFDTTAGQILVAADFAWMLAGMQVVRRWMSGIQA